MQDEGHDTLSYFNPNSRMRKDFENIGFIGGGAYGKVFKARNKLDGCNYAIKRILLSATDENFNRKTQKEVELLSTLTHKNIVRYYNAWIGNEKITEEEKLTDEDITQGGEINIVDDDSFDIIFWKSTKKVDDSSVEKICYSNPETSDDLFNNLDIRPFLYIQMEYCDRKTLRDIINTDRLYTNRRRIWRFFKEIVEALHLIHHKSIIHRDLKPDNIFIDSEDRIKIGDFGVATRKRPTSQPNSQETDASHTANVGTKFYIAPEIDDDELVIDSRIHYNEKVDIYSLGIIFFEMCYRPFTTAMERTQFLDQNVRKETLNLPLDENDKEWNYQVELMKKLLSHNPAERPSAEELSKNQSIPYYIHKEEENQLFQTIPNIIHNSESVLYDYLITECFKQNKHHSGMLNELHTNTNPEKDKKLNYYIEIVRKVFQLHGGINFTIPAITPKNIIMDEKKSKTVFLMTPCGDIVNLPHNLRLSFARYLAKIPQTTHMKRYAFDRVFRWETVLNEDFNGVFDIVSPKSENVAKEAELLSIVCEICDSLPELSQKKDKYVIYLNHTFLISAILCYYDIPLEKQQVFMNFLKKKNEKENSYNSDAVFEANKAQLRFAVEQEFSISSAISLIDEIMKVTILPSDELSSRFGYLMEKDSSKNSFEVALKQLEDLVQLLLTTMRIKCPIVIVPFVVPDFQNHSGITFQVNWERHIPSLFSPEQKFIAVGGRYDDLIVQYKKSLNIANDTCNLSAAGLTIDFDELSNVYYSEKTMGSDENLVKSFIFCPFDYGFVDALVCSDVPNDLMSEQFKLVQELWNNKIRGEIWDHEENLKSIQYHCEENKIHYILYLKKAEPDVVYLQMWKDNRWDEIKFVNSLEIIDCLNNFLLEKKR